MTYDEPHQLRRKSSYARKDSEAALKTRTLTMGEMDRKRACDLAGAMHISGDSPEHCGKGSRVGDLHSASVLDKEVATARAQWLPLNGGARV